MRVRVQADPFDFGAESDAFASGRHHVGAVVTFCGIVRDDGGLQAMEIEHYPAMTAPAIDAMLAEARTRWSLADALVIHRHGRLTPGERIMMVATAAPHRADAFAAADFLMDYLKSRAPFWKKEITAAGAHWVDARSEDETALARWGDHTAHARPGHDTALARPGHDTALARPGHDTALARPRHDTARR